MWRNYLQKGMADTKLSREIDMVRRLPFVAHVDAINRGKVIVINLVPPTIYYLPESRWSFRFQREEFNVGNVITAYKKQVVDYINDGFSLAEKLLNDAAVDYQAKS